MIDIIIPVYNSANTLEKALLSIMFQSIKDKLKIYIIDDYSKDDISSLLAIFSKYLDITYYKNESNLGAGLSRQKGLEYSNSKYVMFLDSDDLFYTHTSIEELYNEIEKYNYDYVSSNTYNEKYNIENNNIGDLHGKIYKRSFLDSNNIKFNELRYDEDNYFNTLVLMNGPTKGFIKKVTYVYKNTDGSLTNNKSTIQSIDYIENYMKSMKSALQNIENPNKDLIAPIINVKVTYLEKIKHDYNLSDRKKIYAWINDLKKY